MKPHTTDLNTFLGKCREMDERTLHSLVIKPFLEEFGATHITYAHGPRELGKDFYYLTASAYGDTELHACQVKNSPFTARIGAPESFHSLLQQVNTAIERSIPHPETNTPLPPDRVVVFNTYELTDAVQLGTEEQRHRIGPRVKYYCGEAFALLVHSRAPTLFNRIAGIDRAIASEPRLLLEKLPECNILGMDDTVSTHDSFVSLRIRVATRGLLKLLSLHGCPQNYEHITLHHDRARDILLLGKGIPDMFGVVECFSHPSSKPLEHSDTVENPASTESDRNDARQPPETAAYNAGSGTYTRCNVRQAIEKAIDCCEQFNQSPRDSADLIANFELLHVAIQTIIDSLTANEQQHKLTKADTLVRRLESSLVFNEAVWDVLVNSPSLVFITGEPGAGKTVLARKLSVALNEKPLRVCYFPCNRITKSDQPLLTALRQYVKELTNARTNEEASDYIKSVQVYVLDGLDEAASVETRLFDDLNDLAMPENIEETHLIGDGGCPPLRLPTRLKDAISVRIQKPILTISVARRLTALEAKAIEVASQDVPYRETIQRVLKRHDLLPRIIATCRDSVVQASARNGRVLRDTFLRGHVEVLDDTQLREFFERWGNTHSVDVKNLMLFINNDDNGYIRDICRTPINAAILFGIFRRGQPLPHNRNELYTKRFDLLLEEWDFRRDVPSRNNIPKTIKMRYCSLLALDNHARRKTSFLRDDAARIWSPKFENQAGAVSVDSTLDELTRSNGIIGIKRNGEMDFGHLSFQEYLAAKGVHQLSIGQRLVSRLSDPWWRNVVIFYVGMVDNVGEFIKAIRDRGLMHGGSSDVLRDILRESSLDPKLRAVIAEMEEFDRLCVDGDDADEGDLSDLLTGLYDDEG